MILPKGIETARLRLASLSTANACDPYLSWMNNPEVTRWLDARFMEHDPDSLTAYIEAANAAPDVLMLGIHRKPDNNHIGNVKLVMTAQHQRGGIGIILGETDSWGCGYAAETISAVSQFAALELGINRLYAGAVATNVGSIKAFLKAGFASEGILRNHWFDGAQQHDVCMLGKIVSL